MSGESKKVFLWLAGAAGAAVIVVLTTLAMKLILKPDSPAVTPPAAVAAAPTPAVPSVAQVIAVKPHYVSESIPERRCHEVQHTVYVNQESSAPGAGAVVGGVAGGLLGSQVGGGRGKIVASVAGATIGAITGANMQSNMNQPQPYAAYSTQCATHYIKTSVQKGYEVTYLYNGVQSTMLMNNAPVVGTTLPLPLN